MYLKRKILPVTGNENLQVVKTMIVNNVNSMANLYTASAVGASARYNNVGRKVQKNDELSLSKEAQNFSEILKKLRGESEVRQDKVKDLEQQIASGNYKVAAGDIALSLLAYRF